MDLVAEIKSRVTLESVVSKTYELRPHGHKLISKEHDSLSVDARRQVWSWFSQPAEAGQKCCGGDLLSWISYQRFGRCRVEGEQFIEVLREACALAEMTKRYRELDMPVGQVIEKMAD